MSANNKIVLQFPDLYLLWKFAQKLSCKSMEINPPAKTLICDGNEEEINRAIRNYSAKILEGSLATASI